MSAKQSTTAACNNEKTPKKKMLKLKLEADDHELVTVDEDVAFKNRLLQQMVKTLGLTDADDKQLHDAIPVSIPTGKTLKKIMEYCTKHRDVVFVPKSENDRPSVLLTEDDEKYLDIDNDELLELLLGANYLDIPGLLEIVTQKIANFAYNRNVEELREIYNIANDLEPAEEEAIRKKYEWMEA